MIRLLSILCFSCLAASAVAQQPRAQRLGPAPQEGASRPRVVEVQASEPIRGAAPAGPRQPVDVAPALNPRQQLAAAKLAAAERQLERLGQYNRWAQGEAAAFYGSRVLPYTQVRPALIPDPVEVFAPASSFSPVLAQAWENRRRAQLELLAGAAPRSGTDLTLEEIDAELQLAEFQRQSAAARLDRLQTVSYLTYSPLWQNLGDRLQLELLDAELRQQQLQEDRRELQDRQSRDSRSGSR